MKVVAIVVIVKNTSTPAHSYPHKPVQLDANECASNNGGCDSKRKCTNTVGSFKCEDCPAGYANDGAKGCKSLSASVCMCVRALVSVN